MENSQDNKSTQSISDILAELLEVRDYLRVVTDNTYLTNKVNKVILKVKHLKI